MLVVNASYQSVSSGEYAMNRQTYDQQNHHNCQSYGGREYHSIVKLRSEADTSYTDAVIARAEQLTIERQCSRQPVQHPEGNGSPTHLPLLVNRVLKPISPQPVDHPQSSAQPQVYKQGHHRSTDSIGPNSDSSYLLVRDFSLISTDDSVAPSKFSAPIAAPCSSQVIFQHQRSQADIALPYDRSISDPANRWSNTQAPIPGKSTSFPYRQAAMGYGRVSSQEPIAHKSPTSLQSAAKSSSSDGLSSVTGFQSSLPDMSRQASMQSNQNKRLSSPLETSGEYSFQTIDPHYYNLEDSSDDHSDHMKNADSKRSMDNIPIQGRPGATASTQPYPPTTNTSAPVRSQQPEAKASVFITYANEDSDPNHIRSVVQISQTLRKNSIDISVDMLEEQIRSMSNSDWVEDKLTKCTFVLICISPSYRNMVEHENEASLNFRSREHTLHTKYIYRRIHTEYIHHGSKNYRYIPVLMSNAKEEHIPNWLRDTKIYQWPQDYEDIIFRLYRLEKYVKPPMGQPPKHSVEQYSSLDRGRSDSTRSKHSPRSSNK